MVEIVLDATMTTPFEQATEESVVRDPSGRALGHFVPQAEYERAAYEWATRHVTDEDLDRAASAPGGRALVEILAGLERA